jgi:surfactin synthase thioesterase subunit
MVATARLPGRESRVHEPVQGLRGLVDDVMQTAAGLPGNAPLLVVGCCSGAVISLEAMAALRWRDPTLVAGLVVVSQWAPDESGMTGRRRLPDAGNLSETLDALKDYGGIPSALVDDPALLNTVLPPVLADWQAVDNHVVVAGPPLPCPILVISPRGDPLCTPERVSGWSAYGQSVTHESISGGHSLLTENPAGIVACIRRNLALFVGRRAGRTR